MEIIEEMIQIGVAGLRNNVGDIVKTVPLFITAKDAKEFNPETGNTTGEDLMVKDAANILKNHFKKYIEETQNMTPESIHTPKERGTKAGKYAT